MRKWLGERFTWRFSLRRLAIGTVFLGAFVGLNMYRTGPMLISGLPGYAWGWPLPVVLDRAPVPESYLASLRAVESDTWHRLYLSAEPYQLPFTHWGHYLLKIPFLENHYIYETPNVEARLAFFSTICGITDALFAIIPLALILFLQIPRRKAPEQVE